MDQLACDVVFEEYSPFIDHRLFLKWQDDLGYGVYTKETIEANKFIEISPVVICEKEIIYSKNIVDYVISWNDKVGIPLGWVSLYNHSDENCCDFSCNFYKNLLAIITNREIKEEEQLTVNYGANWFESRSINKVKI